MPKVHFEETHIGASDFVKETINLLRRMLGIQEIPYRMKKLKETSLAARFRFKNHDFEIYIYADDAEIHRDAESFVCEQADYASESDLIQGLVAKLTKALLDNEFEGNCGGVSWGDLLGILAVLAALLLAVLGGILWFF